MISSLEALIPWLSSGLNSEGFLILQNVPMVRFINYFSIVENMFSHYTGLIRLCVIVGI
jgi:hypothetical protein